MSLTRAPSTKKAYPEPKGGSRKAAVALMTLGPDFARELFGVLEPDEIQRLLQAAGGLRQVTADEVVGTLTEFIEDFDRQLMGVGHDRVLKEAAADVIGHDQLAELLGEEVEPDAARRHLKLVAEADPEAFSQVLAKEHPQIIAVVLAILPPRVGSLILVRLPAGVKGEVMRRVATMRAVPADVMTEVAESLGRELSGSHTSTSVRLDGKDRAVALLKGTKGAQQTELLEALKDANEDLADEIRRAMFTFEDIVNLHTRDVQVLLREIDSKTLTLALKSATPELVDHFLSNMSARAAEMLAEDIEAMGPVAVANVLGAQDEIVEAVTRLAEEGKVNPNPDEAL